MERTWITEEQATALLKEAKDEQQNELNILYEMFKTSKDMFDSLNLVAGYPWYDSNLFKLITTGFIVSNAFMVPDAMKHTIDSELNQHFQEIRTYAESKLQTVTKEQLIYSIDHFSFEELLKTFVAYNTNSTEYPFSFCIEEKDKIKRLKWLVMRIHFLESLVFLQDESLKDDANIETHPELIYCLIILRYCHTLMESRLEMFYPIFPFIEIIEISTDSKLSVFHRLFVKMVAKVFKKDEPETNEEKKIRLSIENDLNQETINKIIEEAENGEWL